MYPVASKSIENSRKKSPRVYYVLCNGSAVKCNNEAKTNVDAFKWDLMWCSRITVCLTRHVVFVFCLYFAHTWRTRCIDLLRAMPMNLILLLISLDACGSLSCILPLCFVQCVCKSFDKWLPPVAEILHDFSLFVRFQRDSVTI